MVSRYEQLRLSPQLKLEGSMVSSSEGSAVSCPIWRAASWSMVMPRYAWGPALANAPLRNVAAERL
jgi:hypothetical protein